MPITRRSFFLTLTALCTLYLLFEFIFNSYAILSVDEFWFAHNTFRFKDKLPYRDLAPYKTVLGYYFLLIPFLFASTLIKTLVFVKHYITILNAIVFVSVSCWLTRFFSRASVLIGLAFILTSDIVLYYSTNIRVDLLGYWFCLFALLFLLENSYLLAGIAMGVAFLITQKAIWYITAGNLALLVFCSNTDRSWQKVWGIIRFNLTLVIIIAAYLLFWSYVSDWQTVIKSVFLEAKVMYALDTYATARKLYWGLILVYNPLMLLAPVALLSVCVTYNKDANYNQRLFIFITTMVIAACLIPYKQVFPYYMQVTIPALFLLYVAFSSWVIALFQPEQTLTLLVSKRVLIWVIVLYCICLLAVITLFNLPTAYMFICMIPLSLYAFITNHADITADSRRLLFKLVVITSMFTCSIYPLCLFSMKLIASDGSYQRANVVAVNQLLQDNSDYVAGIELIYNKSQPIQGLRHLMLPAIEYLFKPTSNLRQVMLASLYEEPNVTVDSIIAALKKSNVKLYVNNYRMVDLPAALKQYLAAEYEHYWGSIYLYAPTIKAGTTEFKLKFPGKYRLETKSTQHIYLNGKLYQPYSEHYFDAGIYHSTASSSYRLKLLPVDPDLHLFPEFQRDKWEGIIY